MDPAINKNISKANTATAFFIISGSILFLNTATSLSCFKTEHIVATKIKIVVILIPPAVDPDPPPINIKIIVIAIPLSLNFV